MDALYGYATELGVQIEYCDLSHLGRNGDYSHELRLVRLQDGMQPRKERHTFAHELAHATFGDRPSMFPHLHQKQERRADEWAAHFLINPDDYREAEERHSGKIDAMATDLYVLEKTVTAYERTMQRIGDTVHVKLSTGDGGFGFRIKAIA